MGDSPGSSRGLRLVGGPMDGWFVKPNAPALREDWYTTWPWRLKLRWRPGHYVKASADKHGVERAKWRPLGGDSQDKPSA